MATGELTDRFRDLRAALDALPAVSEPPKPMLQILGASRSERTWNTLLAYFLNPSQPHGFGAALLKAFLDTARHVADDEIEYYHRDIERVTVETEVASPQNNRLDVLIRVPGEWFVCIESKVDAPQGTGKPDRYVEDPHIGTEAKSEYPEDGHHYLFLSKEYAPDVTAEEFADIYWRHVVEAFQETLNRSHGKYPERSVSQLNELLSTIRTVTNMEEDDYEQIQREKVQLLSEYRDEIDEL
ncbi:MAG: PD-(D/E)XK nuclease family protein, partial [Halarchaeum sp.]